jgi:hypothetical protein
MPMQHLLIRCVKALRGLIMGCGDEKIAVFVILAVVFPLAVFQDRNAASKTLHVQSIDRIVSAQLTPAHDGAGGTTLILDLANANNRKLIESFELA